MAERPGELKDMIKALQRFSARRRLQISEEKSKILMFSKGSRHSGINWEVNGQKYEEVKSFVYLGVEFQRNGQFTRHFKAVARKASRRATEVWSLGERLFPNSFPTRLQMWNSLVLPIFLYASEVTGYAEYEGYELIQRRYLKWTLGLPRGTRNAVLYTETGVKTIRSHALARALKYENRIPERRSETLRAAHKAMLGGSGHLWKDARRRRYNELGWSTTEAESQLVNPQFWQVMRQRQNYQEDQLRVVNIRKCEWYQAPATERPQYLKDNYCEYKIVSRFRCGAESRMSENWRGSVACRTCGEQEETMNHLVECVRDDRGRSFRELFGEEGRGIDWMREVLRERERILL